VLRATAQQGAFIAIIETAHRHGATGLLDGAQSVSRMRTDVQSLDCDFFVFSGHKVFAPTGMINRIGRGLHCVN
jgi:cysteine desulfurase/selenocysteine lyase